MQTKLAFTTLGCPDWDLDTIIQRACKYGFDAVDFRGLLGELEVVKSRAFTSLIAETRQKFEDAGFEMSCFSTSIRLFAPMPDDLKVERKEGGEPC